MRDTDKEAREVARIKKELMQAQMDEYGYCFCHACGRNQSSTILDASHLIPRSYSIALITEPKNIWLHCRKCHRRWERKDYTMPKYNEMLKVVKELHYEEEWVEVDYQPMDATVDILLNRAKSFVQNPPGKLWDGTEVLNQKHF